jgi:MerR family transcriptional regulator, light-induced transcriptional regulator
MNNHNETDKVTIGRAVELLAQEFPDVSISSLRFLEREGLLVPERKPGGHRLYSPYHLETIRRIKRWQAERMSLSEIRRLLEQAPVIGDINETVEHMTARLLKEDIPGALAILDIAHQAGTPLLTICDDILKPVLRNMGDDQGNHLIPVDVQMELDEYLIAFFGRVTSNPGHLQGMPVIVAACPPWERHDLPLRMLVSLLTERGASVHFIGAQVDGEFVADAVARLNPDIVLISITVRPPLKGKAWFQELIDAMEPHQTLFVGGISSQFVEQYEADNLRILGMETYDGTIKQLLGASDSVSSQG